MCDPVTITVLSAVGLGVSVMGQVTGAMGSAQQLKQQAQMQERNAKLQERQIVEEEKAKNLANEELQKESSQIMGAGINQASGSGLDLGSGSLDSWFQEVNDDMQNDLFYNTYNADQKKWGLKNEAMNSRLQAKMYKKSATNALISGGFSALGSAAQGTGNIMSNHKQMELSQKSYNLQEKAFNSQFKGGKK